MACPESPKERQSLVSMQCLAKRWVLAPGRSGGHPEPSRVSLWSHTAGTHVVVSAGVNVVWDFLATEILRKRGLGRVVGWVVQK